MNDNDQLLFQLRQIAIELHKIADELKHSNTMKRQDQIKTLTNGFIKKLQDQGSVLRKDTDNE